MEEPIQTTTWDALSESAKAFANLILGEDQTNFLVSESLSYSQLQEENNQLKVKVAALQESLPFKEKYENLRKEFQKIAAERDSLSSQVLKFNHLSADYDRMKDAYQKTKGQLATIQEQLETSKSSINQYSALETLYQSFKTSCDRMGVDIRRIPMEVFLQFRLQDGTNRTKNLTFYRVSKDKWTRK